MALDIVMPSTFGRDSTLTSFPPFSPLPQWSPIQGHFRRVATKCYHSLHPSASVHTPWCPSCILSSAKAQVEYTWNLLEAEGGSYLPVFMRSKRWNEARIAHDVAKLRLEKERTRDRWRRKREQSWEQAHWQCSLEPLGDGGLFQFSKGCDVCTSMTKHTTSFHVSSQVVEKHTAWWEHSGALAEAPKPDSNREHPSRSYKHVREHKGSRATRRVIEHLRTVLMSNRTEQEFWDARLRTEAALRRKHRLTKKYRFEPSFWDSPISGIITRQNYLRSKEDRRMEERRAKGNMRPQLPRRQSSLSHSESADELEMNGDIEEGIMLIEKRDEVERETRKISQEVGYLYFVGFADGLEYWGDEFRRSDHRLVWRKASPSGEGLGMKPKRSGRRG